MYRLEVDGESRLISSTAPVFAQGSELIFHSENRTIEFAVFEGEGLECRSAADNDLTVVGQTRGWKTWGMEVASAGATRVLDGPVHLTAEAPLPSTGGPMNRLSAPTDWSGAARICLELSESLSELTDRSLLRVLWRGDVARAMIGDDLISDQFWYGPAWEIDLSAYLERLKLEKLELQFLPWNQDAGIWVDQSMRDIEDGVVVESIDVVPVARCTVEVRQEVHFNEPKKEK